MRETINSRKLMQMSMKEGAKFQPYQAELSFNYGHVVLDLESKIQKKEGGTCRISLYGKKKKAAQVRHVSGVSLYGAVKVKPGLY